MANMNPRLDLLFQALSDPTRRAVLEQLAGGPASVGDLAQPHDMALPSFTKHIAMLEQAGLIRSSKQGRVRMCQLVGARLKPAEAWFARQRGKSAEAETERLATLVTSLYRTG
ncbi:transcriptional regulator [Primorskyibacter flagellatus]|uniref:Transcriptional regulator n=1 Tax=Primorskyibacter flagellatus TaxID=1387277 RepID=A0A917A4S4_9RHOB|nr:metalloregulator ArsR/SmtB family transcription factor [Primorskyibacter flagellatus]GGE26621.1 transcriptional regulator [Primorskyibacter flagellatus]